MTISKKEWVFLTLVQQVLLQTSHSITKKPQLDRGKYLWFFLLYWAYEPLFLMNDQKSSVYILRLKHPHYTYLGAEDALNLRGFFVLFVFVKQTKEHRKWYLHPPCSLCSAVLISTETILSSSVLAAIEMVWACLSGAVQPTLGSV